VGGLAEKTRLISGNSPIYIDKTVLMIFTIPENAKNMLEIVTL